MVVYTLSFLQETQRLMQEPVPGISAVPDEGNARYFHVIVSGKFTFRCFFLNFDYQYNQG